MIQSGGVLSPIAYSDSAPSWVNANYYPNNTLALTNSFASYAAVYRTQLWVSTLVNKLAYSTARLPFKVYKRDGQDGRSDARDSPFARLLRNPNPRHDPFFFWLWTASTFELYGEALWVKVRTAPGRPPIELWPLHPANVYTRRDDDTGRLMYVYHIGTASTPLMEWPQDEIVHFKSYNPDNQVRGMSRLEPLRQTITNEDSARRAAGAFWSNGGRPSMALTHPANISDPALLRLKAQWDSIHSGVDNWGKTAILEEGMTPHFFPLNAEEMQYIESRRMNREEACAVFDVPPPVVHILDRATFSNITEQMRSMYRDTMAPRLGLYEAVVDTQLRADFDPAGSIYAEFLLDEVMRGAFEARAVANQSAIFSGQRTPNEVRKQDNLPPLDGGDKLYINSASIPLESAQASPQPGSDIITHPQGVKGLQLVAQCVLCALAVKTSARGLCRSCEGKVGRMLPTTKETQ